MPKQYTINSLCGFIGQSVRDFPFLTWAVRFLNTRNSLANRRKILIGEVNPELEVLVVGPGGSGSTVFLEYVSQYFKCNDKIDQDGLKHLPAPPNKELAPKIIFVYDDAPNVKKSLQRRGILSSQIAKLWPDDASLGWTDRWNFEFLAKRQMEKFSEVSHEKILFVHYSMLFESARLIADFLEADTSFHEDFPKRQARKSSN